jgi:NAD(P)-dependent dehydrogenase (short-subunit alcohol dehydrogenase family)
MARLEGKVALITGAGAGIARATSRLFASEGASVAVVEINPDAGAKTASLVQSDGGNAVSIVADVTEPDDVERAVKEAVEAFGQLNVLYNCAGGSAPPDDSVTVMPIEAWDRCIKLDLYGTFLGSRFGIPELKKAGGGSIINMSSVMNFLGEIKGFPPRHSYSAAKGGVTALTRCIAAEYAKENIRCNAIAPCFVQTDRNISVKSGWSNEMTDTVLDQHPLGLGEPSDIANAALYLASDESRIVNGVILSVDGGMVVI